MTSVVRPLSFFDLRIPKKARNFFKKSRHASSSSSPDQTTDAHLSTHDDQPQHPDDWYSGVGGGSRRNSTAGMGFEGGDKGYGVGVGAGVGLGGNNHNKAKGRFGKINPTQDTTRRFSIVSLNRPYDSGAVRTLSLASLTSNHPHPTKNTLFSNTMSSSSLVGSPTEERLFTPIYTINPPPPSSSSTTTTIIAPITTMYPTPPDHVHFADSTPFASSYPSYPPSYPSSYPLIPSSTSYIPPDVSSTSLFSSSTPSSVAVLDPSSLTTSLLSPSITDPSSSSSLLPSSTSGPHRLSVVSDPSSVAVPLKSRRLKLRRHLFARKLDRMFSRPVTYALIPLGIFSACTAATAVVLGASAAVWLVLPVALGCVLVVWVSGWEGVERDHGTISV